MNRRESPMPSGGRRRRIAVIGAGASGLVAVKEMRARGLEPVAFERSDDLGGLWQYDESKPGGGSLAYRSLEANTSHPMMAFSDFPFELGTPDFPSRRRVLAYLHAYADHFDLRPCLQFHTAVERVIPEPDGAWRVDVSGAGGESASLRFDAVVVASGFYRRPYIPDFPGLEIFGGRVVHSAAYTGPEGYENARVVVVGASSSGADLAAEVSLVARQVDLSARSGVWFVPKHLAGRPYDLARTRFAQSLPKPLRRVVFRARLIAGYRDLGFTDGTLPLLHLPEFDLVHGRFAPATRILERILAGAVRMRRNIARIEPGKVVSEDGESSAADALLFCTGYGLEFPFLDPTVVAVEGRYRVGFYRQVFHPRLDGLAFLAMNFAGGAALPLMEIQARWAAGVFAGDLSLPGPEARETWVQRYFEKHDRAGTDPMSLQLPEYMAEIGGLLGVRPRLWRHPGLLRELLFGPLVPAQYRLEGPGRDPAAADILRRASGKTDAS